MIGGIWMRHNSKNVRRTDNVGLPETLPQILNAAEEVSRTARAYVEAMERRLAAQQPS